MTTGYDSIDGGESNATPSTAHRTSVIGALTAGGRSVVYQLTSFYLRTPLKLFRPARFDYLHYLRVVLTGEERKPLHEVEKQQKLKRFRILNPKYMYYLENSSLGILTKALNKYGWKVIPDRILPPLVVNSAAGVILYTTYLSTLTHFAKLRAEKSQLNKPWDIWRSGLLAGAAQALVSSPIDAIYTRSSTSELLSSAQKYDNLWLYGRDKLKEIGLIGCFGGYGITLFKESLGFAVYFTTFELIKGQLCQSLINTIKHYDQLKYTIRNTKLTDILLRRSPQPHEFEKAPMKSMSPQEEKWFQRTFTFGGGVTAAFLLQVVQFPFSKIQKVHLSRLEAFDIYNRTLFKNAEAAPVTTTPPSMKIRVRSPNSRRLHIYYNSYMDTFEHILFIHKNTNSLLKWLYKGFMRNTLAIIPGTTAGLLLLDYMRSSVEETLIQTPLT
ncbi:ZYRO0E03344p [Zygosaccharomyces rouxii]|uniref:ZYRO0E03344p n=2 Tax=Zygosaccharomyces rouxii TaxID=4956 RepID=C5E469_ZYGRC|nr:uncharacterized protein ZYRO0E03344g [Zygosaccharomyces rouxii]KAH9198311.1 mitochondrial carrier domain-containing protein [Zygosaccharomyces rouxii]CAQ43488.1 Uncharacterised protein KLLA0E22880g [Zygosaccharomyces rouxii]CAR30830.1 ZYRO0E03344p [Zygosaccharomyces rouxii]